MLYCGVNCWGLVPEIIHHRMEGARAVVLKPIVRTGLQAHADEGTCSVEIAETCH
jgi:hypothetical protein